MKISTKPDTEPQLTETWATSLQDLCVRSSLPPSSAQAYGSNAIIGYMQVLAKQRNYVQAGFAMFAEEAKQIFTFDQDNLRVVEQLRGDLVRSSGQGCTETQDFSRNCNSKNQPLSGLGAHRQLRAALAQNKNSSCRLAFAKQHRVSRTRESFFHRVESLEHTCGQIAEEPVGAQRAIEATLLYRALHIRLISRGSEIHSDCSHYFG
jgi:hypothetical protein